MSGTPDWSRAVRSATTRLAAAGVSSPRVDAELLAAQVLGVDRGAAVAAVLRGDAQSAAHARAFDRLVDRRAQREPLQHLTGVADFHRVRLRVGPGVFVPRPETELLVDAVLSAVESREAPRIADLCTGSGALAAAIAEARRRAGRPAQVHAVELDPVAHAWARENLEPLGVHLVLADAADCWTHLRADFDAVVANPPYVPAGQVPDQTEARADPGLALYGGDVSGTRIPLRIAAAASRLLRPGGFFAMEHDESHAESLLASLQVTGDWSGLRGHEDLAGRPRFVTATRAATTSRVGEWNNGPRD